MESAVYPLVHERLPFLQYVNLPGEHSTSLRHALVSPLEYQWHKTYEREDRDEYRVGRATHTATLEPLQFMREYVMFDGRRAGGMWEEFEEKNRGKTILKPEQYELAVAMSEAVRSHPVAGPLFVGEGRNELTIQWRHASGALMKARLDRLTPRAIIDIKTAHDIEPDAFERQSFKLGYHVQAAIYRDAVRNAWPKLVGVRAPEPFSLPFLLVVVSKKAPHDVVVWLVDLCALDAGGEAYERALGVIAECMKVNKWPGMAPIEPVPLKLPAWAMADFDEEAAQAIELGSEVIQ